MKLKDLPQRAQARVLSAHYAACHPLSGFRGTELTQFFEKILNEAEYQDLLVVMKDWTLKQGKEILVELANVRKKERTF